jgi:hypothetical protein
MDPAATCFDTGQMYDFGIVTGGDIPMRGFENFTTDVRSYLKAVVLTNPSGITSDCTSPVIAIAPLIWSTGP